MFCVILLFGVLFHQLVSTENHDKRLLVSDQSYEHSLELQVQQLTEKVATMEQRFNEDCTCPRTEHRTCPDGYMSMNHSCYRIHHNEVTWPEAVTFCKAFGAHLVVENSRAEHEALTNKLIEVQGSYKGLCYWIGASDANMEGQYIWIDSQKPADIVWGPSDPNGGDAADCACMFQYADYNVVDESCSTRYNFICEIELAV